MHPLPPTMEMKHRLYDFLSSEGTREAARYKAILGVVSSNNHVVQKQEPSTKSFGQNSVPQSFVP